MNGEKNNMEALLVLKHMKRTMVRFTTLSGVLLIVWLFVVPAALAAEENVKPLTNEDVIKMLAAKIPESVIVAKIQAGKVRFDTSTDALIELHKQGVSEKVLNAMLNPQGNSQADAKNSDARSPSSVKSPEPAATATPAVFPSDTRDPLSYGTATGLVKKGVTTQTEILERFGAPSVMTTDRDGTETWMYDKIASTVSSNSKQATAETRKSEAEVMARFFGIPFVAGIGGEKSKGKEDTKIETEATGTTTRSIKTITFIIKFNTDKTVKDYSVRQATY